MQLKVKGNRRYEEDGSQVGPGMSTGHNQNELGTPISQQAFHGQFLAMNGDMGEMSGELGFVPVMEARRRQGLVYAPRRGVGRMTYERKSRTVFRSQETVSGYCQNGRTSLGPFTKSEREKYIECRPVKGIVLFNGVN
jgi:hypothetical protein